MARKLEERGRPRIIAKHGMDSLGERHLTHYELPANVSTAEMKAAALERFDRREIGPAGERMTRKELCFRPPAAGARSLPRRFVDNANFVLFQDLTSVIARRGERIDPDD